MSSDCWYWDTCIFLAFLNGNRAAYGQHIDQIAQFLDDCKDGKCAIYTSTITIAEITRKHLVSSAFGAFSDFLNDFSGSITQIGADPNVMLLASAIRGLSYSKTGGNREMGTPDAIHLASALTLEDTYGIKLAGFHTFDNGKNRGLDGKSVPLLTYESWCENCATDPVARRVTALKRSRPDHPHPRLLFTPPAPTVLLQPTIVDPNGQDPSPPNPQQSSPEASPVSGRAPAPPKSSATESPS